MRCCCTCILQRFFLAITVILFQQTTQSEIETLLSVHPSYCCENIQCFLNQRGSHDGFLLVEDLDSQQEGFSKYNDLHRCGILTLATNNAHNGNNVHNVHSDTDTGNDSNWILRSRDGTYQNIPAKVCVNFIFHFFVFEQPRIQQLCLV